MHEFHFLGAVFGALVVFMVACAIVAPRLEAESASEEGQAQAVIPMEPWKLAKPVGALLAAVVLFIYAYFALA